METSTSSSVFVDPASKLPKPRLCSGVLLLLSISSFAIQMAAQTKPQSVVDSCAKFGDPFQNSNDVIATESYRSAIRKMVEGEDFKKLDCIADSARKQDPFS